MKFLDKFSDYALTIIFFGAIIAALCLSWIVQQYF